MGHTVQLQWSFNPPAGRQISLADIILPRILESYSLHTPARSTVQFRTYRSAFPTPSSSTSTIDPNSTKITSRYLTTITTLPNPLPPGANPNIPQDDNRKEEDITYLFLDDRSVIVPQQPQTQVQAIVNGTDQNTNQTNGSTTTPQQTSQSQSQTQSQRIDIDKDTLDEDGFEIIDMPKDKPSNSNSNGDTHTTVAPGANDEPQIHSVPQRESQQKHKEPSRFRCLIVRPTSNVQPMLQSLLSPFVLGYTKSAKAAASTTSSTLPTPTPLPGTSLLLTVLTFNPYSDDGSSGFSLRLKVFILPNPNATSIFLQVEHTHTSDSESNEIEIENQNPEQICKTFLAGCLIDGLNDHRKWVNIVTNIDQQDELLRNKQSIFTLTRSLRESGFI
ncbi:hypothetical protein V865_004337 [Kwoniella europaea PYCC6329]|uniref:Mediator of RNA polymerase II transcription subunit 13 n=1 Tax=Kwoniella europaea PYCC6329 TaxID=1423913 RepID=A0AAX4KI94_9TREE